MVKAVIFDLDGVITDTAEYHYLAWRNMASSIGIEIDREFNERLKGISRDDSLDLILDYGGKLQAYTNEEKQKLAESKNNEYVELLSDLNPANIYPGIKELLDEIKDNGLKIGLASASKNGPVILNKLQVSDYFETIVDPAIIENGKPAPDIFLEAAKDLGVDANECIGIEDAEAGIKSIKDANMFAVGVGTFDVMKAAGADLIFEDTKEMQLSQLLKSFDLWTIKN